jgi:uncharacterized protein YjbI with pentapeptide repeats
MLGLRFEDCKTFLLEFSFSECILNFSSFYGLNIQKQRFENCQLHEVDFTECNLSRGIFKECELNNAIFERTNLEKVDLQSARNFSISPNENKLKGAIFSKSDLYGLVSHLGIIVK